MTASPIYVVPVTAPVAAFLRREDAEAYVRNEERDHFDGDYSDIGTLPLIGTHAEVARLRIGIEKLVSKCHGAAAAFDAAGADTHARLLRSIAEAGQGFLDGAR